MGFFTYFGRELEEWEGWFRVSVYDVGEGTVIYRWDGQRWEKVKGKALKVFMGDRPAFPRDEMLVRGRIKGDTLFVEEALFRKGVKRFYEFVDALLIKSTFSEDQYLFALSVITGVKRVKWEVKKAFYETGTGHVLAISGLHVGLIFLAVSFVLRFLVPLRYAYLFATLLIWMYSYAVGFMPSVVRAATMLSFFSGAKILRRPYKPLNVLFLSLLALLLFKPLWLFSPSLWLSYSAVLGFLIFRNRWLATLLGPPLYSLPFALKYFGRYALLYVPLNLVVIPLMTAFMYSQVLSFVFPYPFKYSAYVFYEGMERIVVWAHAFGLPALKVRLGWEWVLIYIFALSVVILLVRWLRWWRNQGWNSTR